MMELFTLGANRGAYTETDVREQARALTGWQGSVVNRQITRLHVRRRPATTRARRRSSARPATTPGRTRASSASTTRCTRRSSSRSSGATSSRRARRARRSTGAPGAVREPPGPAGRRGDPHCTRLLQRARAWSSRRSSSTPACCGCAAATSTRSTWWTLGQQAGQQLFYPPDVGGWDDTRWLDTATFRARWFIAARRAGRRRRRPTARATRRKLSQRALQFWGCARRSRRTTQGLLAGLRARRSSSARSTPADVETALRRLIASSPDLQTA